MKIFYYFNLKKKLEGPVCILPKKIVNKYSFSQRKRAISNVHVNFNIQPWTSPLMIAKKFTQKRTDIYLQNSSMSLTQKNCCSLLSVMLEFLRRNESKFYGIFLFAKKLRPKIFFSLYLWVAWHKSIYLQILCNACYDIITSMKC